MDVNTNLQMWARGMAKYGDDFVYLKIDPEKGIVGVQQLPNIEIERLERGMAAKSQNVDEPKEHKGLIITMTVFWIFLFPSKSI